MKVLKRLSALLLAVAMIFGSDMVARAEGGATASGVSGAFAGDAPLSMETPFEMGGADQSKYGVVFRGDNDRAIPVVIDVQNHVKVEPANAVILQQDTQNGGFWMWAGTGEDATVTLDIPAENGHAAYAYQFKVCTEPRNRVTFLDGTLLAPRLVQLTVNGTYTNLFYSRSKANNQNAQSRTVDVGLAFVDYSDFDSIGSRDYAKTVEGLDNVAFAVGNSSEPGDDRDAVVSPGVTGGIHRAGFSTWMGQEWRDSTIHATFTVNGASYTSVPYAILYNEYFETAKVIDVPTEPGTGNLVYIDTLNKLIVDHAISRYNAMTVGVTVPYLQFAPGTHVVPNPASSSDRTVVIPDDKVIKLLGDRSNKGSVEIHGNVLIEGRGASRTQFEALSFWGKKGGQAKLDVAFSGGECQLQDVRIADFGTGIDMADGAKSIRGGRIDHCGIGLLINNPNLQNLEFNETTFDSNSVASVKITADAASASDVLNLRANWFLENAENAVDILYEGTAENKLYLIQNFFGNKDKTARPAKIDAPAGAVQHSPFYNDFDLSVLDVDKADAAVGASYYLPVDTSLNTGLNLSHNVINELRDEKMSIPLIDGSNMNQQPTAIWEFAKGSLDGYRPEGSTAMNVRITEDIAPITDTVGSYQPISFSHSGKLPGQATVSVKDTSNVDTTKTLYLYKLNKDTGKLTKQPQPVSYANGMFQFSRDDCSDYIITDTELSGGNNDNDTSGGGGSDGGGSTITSDDVKGMLENKPGNLAEVSVVTNSRVSSAVFEMLRSSPNSTLVLKGDGYQWNFRGSDLLGAIPGLITFNSSISTTSPNASEIAKLTGNASIMNLYLSYHGQLPGRAVVTIQVPSQFAGKPLNLYYYNPTSKKLETVATGLTIKAGKVSFALTHASDYILTDKALAATGAYNQYNNPETGGPMLP